MSLRESITNYLETRPLHIAQPGNTKRLYKSEVETLMQEELDMSFRIFKNDLENNKVTELEVRLSSFNNFCQNRGARLKEALEKNDLKLASIYVNELSKMIELVEGGHICPMHEPYLLKYLEQVEKVKPN